MACTITIDATTLSATTNSAGEVIRIDVEGDTTGCDEVHVSAHDDTAGIAIGDTVAQIDASGHWTASFVDGQGFSLKGVECDDKMTIKARCASDGEDCSDTVGPELRCKPGGCPDVTVTVEQQDCTDATHRTMKFHVTVGGGAQIQYMWNFGDCTSLTPLAPGGQLHQDAFLRRAKRGLQRQPDRCGAGRLHGNSRSDHRRRAACGDDACPDNPRLVALLHLPRGRRERVDIDAPCVRPGDYTITVANAYPDGTALFWSVDDQPAGQGQSIEISIDEGQTVKVEVIATKDGCPPVSESIELSGCRAECPKESELVLERRELGRRPERIATDEGCIAAGDYVVRLIEPGGDVEIDWFEDGVAVPNQHARTLRIESTRGRC